MEKLKWLWKCKWKLLILCAILAFLFVSYKIYTESYQSTVKISFVYPNAEKGLYPDGSRMLMYDIVDSDNVERALAVMKDKGWYKNISKADIHNNISIKEYLISSVSDKVSNIRNQGGTQYTYYANEYLISYHQPIKFNFKSPGTFFGLFEPNKSSVFINELARVFSEKFSNQHTDLNVFVPVFGQVNVEDYDYSSVIDIYKTQSELCIGYLNKKRLNQDTFISKRTNKSIGDMVIAYQSLIDYDISNLNAYTQTLRLTNQPNLLNALYTVNIDDTTLLKEKSNDEYLINGKAMIQYDHTFTENIIVVSANEKNGLYQARPKTAYDTVTQQSLEAGVLSTSYDNQITETSRKLSEYVESQKKANYNGLIGKAESMVDNLVSKYNQLIDITGKTLEDYNEEVNNNYLRIAKIEFSVFSLKLLGETAVVFIASLVILSGLFLISYWNQYNEKKRKAGIK